MRWQRGSRRDASAPTMKWQWLRSISPRAPSTMWWAPPSRSTAAAFMPIPASRAAAGITDQGKTMLRRATPERLSTFSDGVFAVLITVLVLELRPPEQATIDALLALWPTGLSYAVSYLFIAIVWANHHYLLRYATETTPRLLWFNFAHLFSISLLPLSTAWMAVSKLSPQPVAFYAATFVLVNLTYIALIWELVDPTSLSITKVRAIMHARSLLPPSSR